MRTYRSPFSRLLASATLALLSLPLGAFGAAAAPRLAPGNGGSHHARPGAPLPGPQQLHTVPADAVPLLPAGDRRFGVVSALADPPVADALHVGWERVGLSWSALQINGPDTWNGANTGQDAPFDAELAHGRQLIGVVTGVPPWAARDPRDGDRAVPKGLDYPWTDPRNYWGQFIYRLARHYAGRIDTFIIGNEVDLAYPDGRRVNFAGTPAQYAQMVRVAYLAAHAANPHVAIHLFGDSVYGDNGRWLSQTLDALAAFPDARANGLFFDAAELHLYSTVLRWDWLVGLYRGILRAHHVDKPLWLSETNTQPRDDPSWPLPRANYDAPQAIQGDFLVQAFAAALGLGFARVEVYKMRDGTRGQGDHPLGLVRADGSVRPEARAFGTLSTWLAGVRAARYWPGSEPGSEVRPLFRVTLERPGQRLDVLWDQGGRALVARVPALGQTAEVVTVAGHVSTLRARGGVFVVRLAGATEANVDVAGAYVIGGAPVIVAQALGRGQHVPGLHPLVGEQNRTPAAGSPPGPLTSIALAPDGSGIRAIADPAHDRVLVEGAQGRIRAVIGHTGGAPGEFRGPAGVVIGADGTLYVADQGNARIQEFTLSGRLLGGFGSPQAPGGAGLAAPAALAVAPDGTLYVVDVAQDAVLHFDRMGQILGRWGGYGHGADQFDGPGGIAVDGQGVVYVADTLNNRVEAFDGAGHPLLELGTGQAGADGTRLHWPSAVTVLPGGGVAISDVDNTRVVMVTHPDPYLGSVSLDAVGQPGGLAAAPDGTYYVSDDASNRVVHLDASGQVLASFGTTGYGLEQFHNLLGLRLGPDGNLYVANEGNNDIVVLTPDLGFLSTIGHQGSGPGQLLGPHAVAVARDGTLWVADSFNARVEHFSADGNVLRVIAPVNGPWGVATDKQGGVYYTARWGQRLYHWQPGGRQEAWGGLGSGAGEFTQPGAVAASADGRVVYVVDESNKRVEYLVDGRVAGQRGGANAGPGGLGDPVDVAVAPDGTLAVLDGGRTPARIVRYAGATAGTFAVTHLSGVPLGLAGDAQGLTVAECNVWTAICAVRAVRGRYPAG